jgi:hypothetical protein
LAPVSAFFRGDNRGSLTDFLRSSNALSSMGALLVDLSICNPWQRGGKTDVARYTYNHHNLIGRKSVKAKSVNLR